MRRSCGLTLFGRPENGCDMPAQRQRDFGDHRRGELTIDANVLALVLCRPFVFCAFQVSGNLPSHRDVKADLGKLNAWPLQARGFNTAISRREPRAFAGVRSSNRCSLERSAAAVEAEAWNLHALEG